MKKILIMAIISTGLFAGAESKAINECQEKLSKKDKSVDLLDVTVEGSIYRTKWETKEFYIYCNVNKKGLFNISKEKRNENK